MSVLKREEILSVSDIKLELVPVPEWGGDVWVKGMTGAERDKFEGSFVALGKSGKLDMSDLRAKLCSFTVCDKDGKLLFTGKDIKALSQKSAAALQRIFKVAQRLSGIGEEDVKELMEGLEKSPFEDSASDSLVT